ncbi:hypothetical protein glysoja_009918 [Glycine soja]|nr:hypothetical protein glysoja_009918 [Glycine soja]
MLHIYYIFHNGNLSSCPNNPFLPLFTVVFFILPIEKDPATLQYSTSIDMATTPTPQRTTLSDVGLTNACKQAKGTACITCTNHTLKTGCTNNTCGVDPFNPLGAFFVSGDVDEDIYLVLRPLYTCHASFLHVLGLMAFCKTSPRSRKGSWALQGLLFPYQHNSHFVYLQLQSITIFDDDPSRPNVSTIDLVLKGGFQWRIYGANSMVKVAKNVLCLAFVDGGFGAMKFHCNFDCHWWVSDGGQSFGV